MKKVRLAVCEREREREGEKEGKRKEGLKEGRRNRERVRRGERKEYSRELSWLSPGKGNSNCKTCSVHFTLKKEKKKKSFFSRGIKL